MICEECGNEMIWFRDGSVQGWKCPDCQWSVLTTCIDEIYSDMTVYSIYLIQHQVASKEQLNMVSKIANVNYIQARKMLNESKVLLCRGSAIETKDNLNKLRAFGLQYQVKPEFNHSL